MRKINKQINNVGRVIIDTLMLMLFLGIVALPASSGTLLHVIDKPVTNIQVLSAQDNRAVPVQDEVKEATKPVTEITETDIEDAMRGMDLGQSGQ